MTRYTRAPKESHILLRVHIVPQSPKFQATTQRNKTKAQLDTKPPSTVQKINTSHSPPHVTLPSPRTKAIAQKDKAIDQRFTPQTHPKAPEQLLPQHQQKDPSVFSPCPPPPIQLLRPPFL